MKRILDRIFNGPAWRTFLLMGVFGGLFAITSFDLLMQFTANFEFISSYGVMALKDGGVLQLIQLIATGYLSIALYLLFKGCLYGLLGHFVKH
jgi:hypothetical protein